MSDTVFPPSAVLNARRWILPPILAALGLATAGEPAKAAQWSKSTAILGQVSALQAIARQQAGIDSVLAETDVPAPIDWRDRLRLTPPASARSGGPDIFGSTALPLARTRLDGQWRRASSARLDAETGPWAALIRELKVAPRADQIERVNRWVNARVAFADDADEYGRGDRWAGAAEALQRGRGDCEDYAIAKMQLLRAAGFPKDDLYVTVVDDLVRRASHAVLVARIDGHFLVLDNNTDRIVDAGATQDYRPVLTFAADGAWTHGYRRAPVRLAAAGGAPNAASR